MNEEDFTRAEALFEENAQRTIYRRNSQRSPSAEKLPPPVKIVSKHPLCPNCKLEIGVGCECGHVKGAKTRAVGDYGHLDPSDERAGRLREYALAPKKRGRHKSDRPTVTQLNDGRYRARMAGLSAVARTAPQARRKLREMLEVQAVAEAAAVANEQRARDEATLEAVAAAVTGDPENEQMLMDLLRTFGVEGVLCFVRDGQQFEDEIAAIEATHKRSDEIERAKRADPFWRG